MPHIPLARSADFVGHSSGGIYGDVIEEIDWSTGRILDALRAAGVDGQTLVVFTSDNGPWLPFETHGGIAPVRSGRAKARRGKAASGRRRSSGGRDGPAGDVSPTSDPRMDLLPTAARLPGARLPADRVIDGVDLRRR